MWKIKKNMWKGIMTLLWLAYNFHDSTYVSLQVYNVTHILQGKNLLYYCISYQLRILNGRVLGDAFGKYTCFTPQGCSVVDYVIVSETFFFLFSTLNFYTIRQLKCTYHFNLLHNVTLSFNPNTLLNTKLVEQELLTFPELTPGF
jgi:hypothetical protein